jgi:electron transport complex protein RnfB
MVAVRLCLRPKSTSLVASYLGPPSCALAGALDDGPYACPEACLGFGDCAGACPAGALGPPTSDRTPPLVDIRKCLGCGLCLAACPRGLIVLRARATPMVVRCSGSFTMKEMDKLCSQGCLGCGKCRKACPVGAVSKKSERRAPSADEEKCSAIFPSCGRVCQKSCPRGLPRPALWPS